MTDMPAPDPVETVAVTGASGFVGGHLAEALAEQGQRVVGIDCRPPPRPLPAGVRFEQIDLRDAGATRRVIVSARPQIVYHLAAQASVSVSMREPRLDVEHNVLATMELAVAAANAGSRRLVFVSSGGAIHGLAERLPADERTPLAPLSIYGASKAAAELYLHVLAGSLGIEVAVVRPTNIYGPRQDPHGEAGVVAIFTERMLADEPVTIFGDGTQTRDYVYVGDVVRAIRRAGESAEPATCAVSTGEETSTYRIFELLARLTGYEREPIYAPERPGDLPRNVLDPKLAGEVWDWSPSIALEDGLGRTVEWFRAAGQRQAH